MLQQYKLKEKEQKRKAQAIIESMIKGNDGLEKQADGEVGGRLMGATPSSRWHLVKDELVLKSMLERDRKSKDSWNPEVNPMPMQTVRAQPLFRIRWWTPSLARSHTSDKTAQELCNKLAAY